MHFVCYISRIACVETFFFLFVYYFAVYLYSLVLVWLIFFFIILFLQFIMVYCFVTKQISYRIFSCLKKLHPLSLIQIPRFPLFFSFYPQSVLMIFLFHLSVSFFLFQYLSALFFINMHCFSKGIKALAIIFVFRLQNAAGVILFVCVFSA